MFLNFHRAAMTGFESKHFKNKTAKSVRLRFRNIAKILQRFVFLFFLFRQTFFRLERLDREFHEAFSRIADYVFKRSFFESNSILLK